MDQNPTDAKIDGVVSSPTQETKPEVSQTQVDEKSIDNPGSTNEGPFHEHPRFKELVDEKNRQKMENERLSREVELLKRQSAGTQEASRQRSVFDQAVDHLVDKGMDRSAAVEFMQHQAEFTQAIVQQSVAPLYQSQGQFTLNQAMEQFKREHKDFDQYNVKMSEILGSMSKEKQDWILSNLSDGVETLYLKARELDRERVDKELVEKGKTEAYEKKREKSSVNQTTSSSLSVDSMLKALRDTPMSEYEKKKAEFDKYERSITGLT